VDFLVKNTIIWVVQISKSSTIQWCPNFKVTVFFVIANLPESLSIINPRIGTQAFQLGYGKVDTGVDVDDEDEVEDNLGGTKHVREFGAGFKPVLEDE